MRRFLPFLLALGAACAGDTVDEFTGDVTDTLPAPADSASEQAIGTPEAAVAVIRDYYDAIAGRDFERAYRHWSGEGEASGQSLEDFRSGFRETASVEAQAGPPGRLAPAAGSRYITIPVVVRATTTSGERQCFRGTYTLRRSEVTGATEEQRRWHITSADVEARDIAACAAGGGVDPAVRDSIVELVTRFGERLASVSLLAPPEVLVRDLRTHYGPLVTSELLDEWLGRPSEAPGREVSSPWPARIEAITVTGEDGNRYRVTGEVVYVTSTEVGSGGAADRRPIELEVVRAPDGGWRIADYLRRR